MNITLESVRFRIPGADNGAFNISVKTEDGRRIVAGPEWLPGERRPAGLAHRTGAPFIDVSVRCSEGGTVAGRLEAAAIGGHVLGAITPRDITFQSRRWAGRIVLDAAQVKAVGHHNLRWHWKVTAAGQEFTFDSDHEVFTVPGTPQNPWETDRNDPTAAPWVEALTAACGWAPGKFAEEVLTAIASHHYHSGQLRYGGHMYTENGFFKLAKFLRHQSQDGINDADCADCSTIVAIFGKLLGASCRVAVLDTRPETRFFPLATTVFLGGQTHPNIGFNQHEAALNVEDTTTAGVWDFCLGHEKHGVAQPYTGTPFLNSDRSITYPFRTFIPGAAHNLTPIEFPVRQLGETSLLIDLRRPADPARFDFNSWRGVYRYFKGLAFANPMVHTILAAPFVEHYEYKTQPKPWLTETIFRLGDEILQISVFETGSRDDAHLVLNHLLGEQRRLPLLQLLDEPIGDVLFYDAQHQADLLLFALGNLTVRLQRSVGGKTSLIHVAGLVVELLLNKLADLGSAAAGILGGLKPPDLPGMPNFARFFCETAEIAIDGADVKLRAAEKGDHLVAVDHHVTDWVRSTVVNLHKKGS